MNYTYAENKNFIKYKDKQLINLDLSPGILVFESKKYLDSSGNERVILNSIQFSLLGASEEANWYFETKEERDYVHQYIIDNYAHVIPEFKGNAD